MVCYGLCCTLVHRGYYFLRTRENSESIYIYITYIYQRLPCVSCVSHRRHRSTAVAPIETPYIPPQYPHQLHTITPEHRGGCRATPHHIPHPQYHPKTLRCLDAIFSLWQKETSKMNNTLFSTLTLHSDVASEPGTSNEYRTHATETE
jgi:hypothetical protein